MTELQPSPAGYRGQDEVPGPPTHPVAFGKSYPSHGHIETCNYSIPGYLGSQAHAGSKQQPLTGSRGSSPGDHYRRKSDRWTSENDSNLGDNAIATKTAITGYNEGYGKKNTPGYKNDSGYSESIGFDSYSLPFNEADEASPPPTPPVRDASSLKGVCCGPGHEKYPSWPSTASEHHHHHQHYPDNDIDSSSIDLECSQSGSHRSKSWTDDTNYSKDKPAQYSRPLAKRPNPTFTQQLKTVMERCEKIPTENYESRGSRTSLEDDQTRLWPCVDRESNSLGATDPEYVVAASPSDRDQHQHQHQHQQQPQHQKQSPQTLSHADLEAYVRNYHDPQVSQVDIYRETALTQAGLEEYTRVQHSQQASYAQSEGYHSYVSSVDSTTNTPFLDRLRRDSEAVAQRAAPSWEETSREGRDSVVTTSSGGSASSSETLKWHGSMSDVSISSGLPTRQVNGGDVWPHGSMSDVSSINGSGIQKHTIPHDSDHDKWQGSMSDVSSSLMISSSKLRLNNINNNNNSNNNNNNNNSNNNINSNGSISMKNNDNKWQENKWQATMNDRNCKQISSRTSLPSVISHYASVNDVCQASSGRDVGKWQESSIDEETLDKSKGIQRGWESCINVDQARYNHNSRPIPQSSMSQSQTQAQTQSQSQSQTQQQHNSDDWNPLHGSMSDVSQANISIHSSSKQLIAHSARVQTPQRHHSESVLYLDRERTLRKLYPVSTSQRDEPGQTRISPVSPQQPHLSVAERINELEKQQQQMRYTYLDPEKRHRVSDPTLKAIQKKALLSYYERHHQSSWRSEPQLAQGAVPPQSPPPQPPPRPRPPSSRRASSASDYASISWREKTSPSQGQRSCDLPSPKHQHSNSCGSLSTDLLGPVIVGPAISIDDWVPERPPKKPHLRAVYDSNNRVPSPDLPPPSPPTVTESEVLNCDEPLPPPPPPLNEPEAAKDQEEKRQSSSSSSSSSRRSSKQSKKVETNSATNGSKPQFIRATPLNLEFTTENVNPGFATHRVITGRSSLRYPSAQKLSVTRRTSEELTNNSSRPPARLPELSPRYSHPVESRIIRQESMRVESTRVDASGLIKMEDRDRVLESSTGQRPQPQVPKTGLEKTSSGYSRPNYLALSDCNIKNGKYSEAMGYTVAPGVKTSYEANAKLLEGSPQKYHDPPKYVGSNQRNYYVLPSKFSECEKFLTSPSSPPPPLAPRQSCGRKSLAAPPRPAPPSGQGSQSKASYLAYKRERGAPDSEGSYKRTMSPTARLEDWPPPRDRDDPVLLRVTPHHPLHNNNHINNNNNNNNHNNNNSSNNNNTNNSSHNDLPKSHSVDALHHRIEERTNAHSVEVMGKLSHELSKKLQASDTRPRSESNNNILNNNNHNNINNNHNNNNHDNNSNNNSNNNNNNSNNNNIKRDLKERVSPQSVQVLNDRNRQLERERRKLAANCEAIEDSELLNCETKNGIEDFYCERSATIEMTSKNVELLNRRNILPEKRHSTTGTTTDLDHDNSLSSTSTSTSTSSSPFADKSPPTTSPRFAKMHKNEEVQLRSRGAVPRRSGSCSSSSSSRSSLEQGLTHSRSSPAKIYSNNLQNREHRKSLPELENVKESYPAPRSKVSSPAQTESSWMKLGASQTDTLFTSRLRRSPSSGSRSSSLSSASKISSSSSSLSPRYSPIEGKSSSPCVSPQPGIEGLTLMQRTEVILRVNTTTMDVASQTEALDEEEPAKEVTENTLIAEPRRKLPEEIECEKLSRDLASQLGPNDKLVTILVPVPELKKPTDYMSGLFRVETTLQPRPRRLVSIEPSLISTATENGSEDRKNEMPSTPNNGTNNTTSTNNNNNTEPSSPVSPTSTYLMTSEGKARFLTQYSQDIGDVKVTNGDTPSNSDSDDLKQKKEELVMRLDRKVVVLKAEQEAVREEGEMNETLGAKIASRVAAVAQSAEASKYKLHVEEVGMITNLLVVLSGRLARAENALHGMPANHSERKILEAKRDQLLEQLHDAKVLKINIDKRSVNVSAILSKYLNNEEFADYQHFITMKTKLIMDGREIQDKVKLGEEQLAALKEAIG